MKFLLEQVEFWADPYKFYFIYLKPFFGGPFVLEYGKQWTDSNKIWHMLTTTMEAYFLRFIGKAIQEA